jgi:hypothetical protein
VYNAKYVSNTGETYDFGVSGSTVFDMDIGNGLSVDISTSQGFAQMGESVEGQNVSGRLINVKGVIYKDISNRRKMLRSVFSPFTNGRLTFDNGYYIDVYVKDTPTFSPVKNDGRFTMLLYAPFPFFSKADSGSVEFGELIPGFSFPVNYAEPHTFGTKEKTTVKNIINDGDVPVSFNVTLETTGRATNTTITDLDTGEFLRIQGNLLSGQKIVLNRTTEGVLKAVLIDGAKTTNIINRVDENSTLDKLKKGVNRLRITDDYGDGEMLIADFTYNTAVTSIYED